MKWLLYLVMFYSAFFIGKAMGQSMDTIAVATLGMLAGWVGSLQDDISAIKEKLEED